jgi:hypothetical protein
MENITNQKQDKPGKEDNLDKPGKNINIINSLKENWLSWIFIFISVTIVSYPNYLLGLLTFFVFLFIAYFSHLESHKKRTLFTILHHYHHENNNFFSHISQVLIELCFPMVLAPFYFIFGTVFFDEWILLLFAIFYSSVHNINYGMFRVNDVHYLHHQFMNSNIGPDICDIIFNSKHPENVNVENTNHYIPNIIIGTIIVLIIKYFYYKDDFWKKWLLYLMRTFLGGSLIFIVLSSIYLYLFYKVKDCETKLV